ncbi:MAG TPA: glutamine--tRNA ligase [Lentisphaeria bacterium]|nr:MAG: glutamine--tRNA ligase [Lentisphaerae bacterium GWF2_38_69]HBM17397.1 glutamine--tRNA ligase [Lentisphaeria bacterium]
MENVTEKPSLDFLRAKIVEDLKVNKNEGKVVTRFPPEPNGYLHIGHAKSICLNFGIARDFNGRCHLRFDDTNPAKEDVEYVDSIMEDVKWLGFDWGNHLYYASDYYDALCNYAIELIKKGKAYVCELTSDEMRDYRGTLTEIGKESPHRNRPAEENLDLFIRMKNGEFEEGTKVLRAKIDMSSPNVHMRDPVIYRIKKAHHHRTGDKWCIYPMYDFAHCFSDSIEGITHSICTLEFEIHRPLYDWFLDELNVACHPQQIEFARLNINYTVMSKRKLLQLVKENHVKNWDDPRMPTISGMRRRGYTPEAIRAFCDKVGVAKRENVIDLSLLEFCVREDLNKTAPRVMAVLNPLKLIIDNYPDDLVEELDAVNNPEDLSAGTRKVPFSKVLYIEKDDFKEVAPKKYFRLTPGQEVRLRYAYIIKCESFVKDTSGEITEVHCTYDSSTRGGNPPEGKKIKGTIHWVAEKSALDVEVRLYDRLFSKENPDDVEEGKTFLDYMNPNSLEILSDCKAEPGLKNVKALEHFQFERLGYFTVDKDSNYDRIIFNRTVALKDTWAKIESSGNN